MGPSSSLYRVQQTEEGSVMVPKGTRVLAPDGPVVGINGKLGRLSDAEYVRLLERD